MATSNVKKSLQLSRKIPATMKAKIEGYLSTSSTYINGVIKGLIKPQILNKTSSKASGVSFGADGKGFFVYTHRARSKSKSTPSLITKKEIDFIESTG
jgi:hypothetical protein